MDEDWGDEQWELIAPPLPQHKRRGKPRALTARQLSIAKALYNDKQHSIAEICQTLKISKATLYRSIKTGERLQPA